MATLTGREKHAYALVLTLILVAFVLALDPILPGGSFALWQGQVIVGVEKYWINGQTITEKINYAPPPDWPRPLIPLPTLLLILTFILPLLTAFQLCIYAFLITFATNSRDWSTTILQPPATIRAYGALVWAGNVIFLSLDAATVARAVDLEPTSLGWATLIAGFILTAIQLVLTYKGYESTQWAGLPCFSAPPEPAHKPSYPQQRSRKKQPTVWDRLMGN